jgi:excisionase family DNA binding protein
MKKLPDLPPADGLRVKEAAALLAVSPKTIYTWCCRGKIRHFKVMGSIRIPRESLAAIREVF